MSVKVFCVIPAYNEAKTIKQTIDSVKLSVDCVVVVDDGSEDETYEICLNEPVAALKHLINRGQGAALKTGTEYALKNGADIIVHFDADGQFRAEDITAVVLPIKRGAAEAVFGSRFLRSDLSSTMPALKKYGIMPAARIFNKIFFHINLTDPQSGFRALSRSAAEKIHWQQDRMAHCSEILFSAAQSGLTIKEVPIKIVYKNFGQKISGGLKILKDLFLARLLN